MSKYSDEFLRVGPGRGHYVPAHRVGMSILLPLLVIILLGREDLAVYSVFGSLTGVYARTESLVPRLRFQSWAGALMITSVILGVWQGQLEQGPWWLIIWSTIFAGLLSIIPDMLRLRPTGPFFFLFAFSTSSAIPFPGHVWEAGLTVIASVATVLAIGYSERLWRPAPPTSAGLAATAGQAGRMRMARHAGRYVAAVAISGTAATLLGVGHGYWAMVAACAPIAAADAAGAIMRGIHRIIGTYGGVILSFILLLFAWPHWLLVLLLSLLQFIGEIFVVRHYSLALVFMTPVALMMTEFVLPQDPFVLTADRALQTTVGAAVAMLIVAITRTRGPRERQPLPDET